MEAQPLQTINHNTLDEMRDLMEEEFNDFVQEFLDNGEQQVAEISQAVKIQDASGIRSASHSFKSNCGYLGAEQLMEFVRRMEYMGRDNDLGNSKTLLEEIQTEFSLVRSELGKLLL